MEELKFDVVIVGGGPAGLSCGITLAKAGIRALLIERGRFCGAKNLFGGVVYTKSVKELVPEFPNVEPSPVERPVTEEGYFIVSSEGIVKLLHRKKDPHEAFTATRARFDSFLAEYALKLGLEIAPKTKVLDLLKEGQRIKGIIVDRPRAFGDPRPTEIPANIVVIAEGVNRVLTEKAGLIGRPFGAEDVALAVKEIIQLPKGALEARLGLAEGQGLAVEIIGDITACLPGTGFIYTNRNHLSFGLGLFLSNLRESAFKPYELLERAKNHPHLRELFKDGEILEYGAHLIPEWGLEGLPRLYGDGVLVVGDSAGLVNPLFREGTNLAIYSGIMAGKTIIEAFEKGDFSSRTLKAYEAQLRESFIYQDLITLKKLKKHLFTNIHLFKTYPELLYDTISLFFSAQGRPKREVMREIFELIRKKRGFLGIVGDLIKVGRALW